MNSCLSVQAAEPVNGKSICDLVPFAVLLIVTIAATKERNMVLPLIRRQNYAAIPLVPRVYSSFPGQRWGEWAVQIIQPECGLANEKLMVLCSYNH